MGRSLKNKRLANRKKIIKKKSDIKFDLLKRSVKRKLKKHLLDIGLQQVANGTIEAPENTKVNIRLLHKKHREDKFHLEKEFVNQNFDKLKKYFASGNEVVPEKIRPRLQLIESHSEESDLFRLASLTWSVPVSLGYGRRLRFLVWDDYNNKLMGIIALGDPVFNLGVRDDLIGWNSKQRMSKLVNMLDAYVLGAVPPYNLLLGGKLVSCLIKSKEVHKCFSKKYGSSKGIISNKRKHASLVAFTTSSSMGRSAVYNRLKLADNSFFSPIGYTKGWGHFHVPENLFEEMRALLVLKKHGYANDHEYGGGPNWRMRVIKSSLALIGLNPNVLKHGISREVFLCKVADNAIEYLSGRASKPKFKRLLSVKKITELALERWVVPRSIRRPEYKFWKSEDIIKLIDPSINPNFFNEFLTEYSQTNQPAIMMEKNKQKVRETFQDQSLR